MQITTKAYAVHLLTASGAVFAMLALLAATKGAWADMYLWLVVAFVVDGIDGPLARRFEVSKNAPTIDGVLLDLIIDYLTYVFIPAFALFQSGLLPGWTGWIAIFAITFTSAIYFADTRMKTADKSFSGFPACWNMVVLVFFALAPGFWTILGVTLLFCVAQFFGLRFIHPVRTKRWRMVSLPMALAWTVFAGASSWYAFDPGPIVHTGLVVTSIYLALVGIVQQILPPRAA